jgi:3-phosphoshikimate 1-carboxyvinyltransferase
MPDRIEIRPRGPLRTTVRPPGSKSLTCRALVCAALAEGESSLCGAAECDDVRAMIESLGRLGIVIRRGPEQDSLRVIGCGGQLRSSDAGETVELNVADSGATARFLTAATTLGRGTYRLDGSTRMRNRPIGNLLGALQQLGTDATAEAGDGRLPVVVHGRGLRGGRAAVPGRISSQFLSALLLAAPYAETNVELIVEGGLVSQPYVAMTLAVMAAFGMTTVDATVGSQSVFAVRAPQRYVARRYEVEPDASSAGYFFAAAAITRGEATVLGLSRESLQGDVAFCECLRRMGCDVQYQPDRITVVGRPLRGIDADMNAISDMAPTLAVAALFAEGPTTIRNVAHIRQKECDRIHAMAVELRRLGAEVVERDDGLTITPGVLHGAEVETYNDHRMAMSLALVGLMTPGLVVRNPGCVAKTYPGFFRDLGE